MFFLLLLLLLLFFFCVYNSLSRYHLVLFRLRVREERVTEKIDDLPVLVTSPSGTSAMLSSEVNGAVAEGSTR